MKMIKVVRKFMAKAVASGQWLVSSEKHGEKRVKFFNVIHCNAKTIWIYLCLSPLKG